MNLNSTQSRILRLIIAQPRTERDLSHRDSLDGQPLASPFAITTALEALQEHGFISRVGMHYYAAAKGELYAHQHEVAGSRIHQGKGTYTGPAWLIREGGLQHLQFKSRGAGC